MHDSQAGLGVIVEAQHSSNAMSAEDATRLTWMYCTVHAPPLAGATALNCPMGWAGGPGGWAPGAGAGAGAGTPGLQG